MALTRKRSRKPHAIGRNRTTAATDRLHNRAAAHVLCSTTSFAGKFVHTRPAIFLAGC
jgi:hypothetical protein